MWGPKRLELARELFPGATTFALLVNPANPLAATVSKDLQAIADTLGVRLHVLHASAEADFEAAFATAAQLRAAALVISGADPLFGGHAAQLGALALRHRVPAIYQYREFAAAGGLMSYGGYRYFGRFFACTGFPNHFFCDSWVVGFLEGPTMVRRTSDWRDELGRWLKPFLDRLGHKARRQMCPLYVSGLIGPGDRKSIQPMAKRLALGECDQLHHFIAAGVWDATPVETELLIQADRLVGGDDAVLVIDDTAIPKKGTHSVGVAAQYASALGKTANCQTLVSLTLARGEVPVMLGLRLFLPESWTSNQARLKRAGVPTEYRTARTKPELALAEIDRVIATGVCFGCVLADAGYGLSAPFRQGLTARKLTWAVGIPRHLKVYPADVRMIWPVARRGRPRQRHVPDILSIPAEDMLANAKWRTISWRTGTKGKLKARFAAV